MRILVTGATGFIGRSLVASLVGREQLSVLAATRHGTPVGLPRGIEAVALGDLGCCPDLRAAVTGCDVVVHAAARVHVLRDTASNPLEEFRRLNVAATTHVAEQAAWAGVRRLVFISSIKVSGEDTTGRAPYRADEKPVPEDAYGISKWEAEQALTEVAERTGLEVVIVRPPLVYGPRVKGNLRRLVRLVERGIPLPLSAVRNRRSLVSVDNLCDLLTRCIEHPRAAGRTFLVSDGEDLSTPELVRGIAAALGRPARLVPVPVSLLRTAGRLTGRGAEVERLCGSLQVDISKTREVLGWAPPVPVREGIRRMVVGEPRAGGFP